MSTKHLFVKAAHVARFDDDEETPHVFKLREYSIGDIQAEARKAAAPTGYAARLDEATTLLNSGEAISPTTFAILKAQNRAIAKSLGVSLSEAIETKTVDRKDNVMSFATAIATIKARDNCTHMEAAATARLENPEAFKAYQGGDAPPVAKVIEAERDAPVRKSAAVQKAEADFNARVSEIQKRDGLKRRTDAAQKARIEYPALWEAVQTVA